MNESNETTLFDEGGVKITSSKAIIGTLTYPLSDIKFVSRQKKEPGTAPYWWALLGGLLSLIGFLDINKFRFILILGFIILSAAGYVIRTARTTYVVRIGSPDGETNIFESRDREYIKSIVDAMNQALDDVIARRGERTDEHPGTSQQ